MVCCDGDTLDNTHSPTYLSTHLYNPPNTQHHNTRVQHAELALRPGWSALLVALHQLLRQAQAGPASPAAAVSVSAAAGAGAGASSSSLYGQMLLTAFHKEYAGHEGVGGVLGCLGRCLVV